MTKKKQRWKMAKEVRKRTGLPMNVSLILSRSIINYGLGLLCENPPIDISKSLLKARTSLKGPYYCSMRCCGPDWFIYGPKGTYHVQKC